MKFSVIVFSAFLLCSCATSKPPVPVASNENDINSDYLRHLNEFVVMGLRAIPGSTY